MRRAATALVALALSLSPTVSTAGADESQMSFSPPTAVPGVEVIVEIQLDRPQVEGTIHGMHLERAIDDPEAFGVTDSIPFDAEGFALFSFTVPDVAPGEYLPVFSCINISPSIDACDDSASPHFGPLLDVSLTVFEPPPPPDYEEVAFRVTLSGPVQAGDMFGVGIECDRPCVTEDVWLVCGPPSDTFILPICEEGTFGFTAEIEAGLVLDYALIRWPGRDVGAMREEHLHGSIVVHEGRQTISLGYVYPGGGPRLPDTAMPADER